MTLVVADASPIHYLCQVGALETLSRFFDQVVIPKTVYFELLRPSTPVMVRDWISNLPKWAVVREAQVISSLGLHRGETEAIALAKELKADAVILDDLNGRSVARALGLTVTGTIGVLERAAEANLIDLRDALDRLKQTNFRAGPDLIEDAWRRYATRKGGTQ